MNSSTMLSERAVTDSWLRGLQLNSDRQRV
jgi:hypothetical protein